MLVLLQLKFVPVCPCGVRTQCGLYFWIVDLPLLMFIESFLFFNIPNIVPSPLHAALHVILIKFFNIDLTLCCCTHKETIACRSKVNCSKSHSISLNQKSCRNTKTGALGRPASLPPIWLHKHMVGEELFQEKWRHCLKNPSHVALWLWVIITSLITIHVFLQCVFFL